MKKYNVQGVQKGLSNDEVERARREHGRNVFSARKLLQGDEKRLRSHARKGWI